MVGQSLQTVGSYYLSPVFLFTETIGITCIMQMLRNIINYSCITSGLHFAEYRLQTNFTNIICELVSFCPNDPARTEKQAEKYLFVKSDNFTTESCAATVGIAIWSSRWSLPSSASVSASLWNNLNLVLTPSRL